MIDWSCQPLAFPSFFLKRIPCYYISGFILANTVWTVFRCKKNANCWYDTEVKRNAVDIVINLFFFFIKLNYIRRNSLTAGFTNILRENCIKCSMNKIEFVTSLTDVDCLICRAHNNTYIDQYYSYCYTMALVSKILKRVTKIPKSNDGITLLRLSDLQYTLVLHKTKKRSPVNISQWYGNILKTYSKILSKYFTVVWKHTQTINWLHK